MSRTGQATTTAAAAQKDALDRSTPRDCVSTTLPEATAANSASIAPSAREYVRAQAAGRATAGCDGRSSTSGPLRGVRTGTETGLRRRSACTPLSFTNTGPPRVTQCDSTQALRAAAAQLSRGATLEFRNHHHTASRTWSTDAGLVHSFGVGRVTRSQGVRLRCGRALRSAPPRGPARASASTASAASATSRSSSLRSTAEKSLRTKSAGLLAAGRAADADAHPEVVLRAGRAGDRPQPVVAALAAAALEADRGERDVELVVDDDEVLDREVVVVEQAADGPAGLVHVGERTGEHHPPAGEAALTRRAREPAHPCRGTA